MAARAGRPAEPNASAAMLAPVPAGHVRMQFMGDRKGPVTYHANGHPYTGANVEEWKYIDALEADVARLEAMGVWKRVRMQTAPEPIPQAVAPIPELIPAPAPLAQPPEYPKGGVAAMVGREPMQPTAEWVGHPTSTEPLPPSVVTVASTVESKPEPVPAPVTPKRKRGRKAKAEAVRA